MADPVAAPRPELIALLDAVKDNPDDDTPRLILADWLDEQDDPLDAERAKFIREDIAAFRNPPRPAVLTEEGADACDERARLLLGPAVNLGGVMFGRGFPIMGIKGPRLLKSDAPKLLTSEQFAFVQFVHLTDAGGP